MSTPETATPVKSLETPDPIVTTESIGTFLTMIVANIYILFGSNLDNARQTALAAIVTSAWFVFSLVHAAYVRGSRAKSGGLVTALIEAVPEGAVPGSDPGDLAARRPPVR